MIIFILHDLAQKSEEPCNRKLKVTISDNRCFDIKVSNSSLSQKLRYLSFPSSFFILCFENTCSLFCSTIKSEKAFGENYNFVGIIKAKFFWCMKYKLMINKFQYCKKFSKVITILSVEEIQILF